jgi:hypothetical protein
MVEERVSGKKSISIESKGYCIYPLRNLFPIGFKKKKKKEAIVFMRKITFT